MDSYSVGTETSKVIRPAYIDERGVIDIPSSEANIDELVTMAQASVLSYPYRRYYGPSPDAMFKALQTDVMEREYRVVKSEDIQTFDVPIPDTPILIIRAVGNSIGAALTDYYTEPQRARAKIANGLMSRYELWMTMTREVILRCVTENDRVNTHSLRGTIKRMGDIHTPAQIANLPVALRNGLKLAPETNNFHALLARDIYREYCPPDGIVMDTSAGWGDRLEASAASGVVRVYIGIDPNLSLFWGYGQIKNNHAGEMVVIMLPIGAETLPYEEEYTVDLVFTSPPYGGLEIYSKAGTQSSSLFATQESWANGFLYEMISRAYYRLKKGGRFVLHLRDIQGHQIMKGVFAKFEELGAAHEGVIGLVVGSSIAPVWIWRKM
jgi:hypothetical protein